MSSVALVFIGFSTDNWLHLTVDRAEIWSRHGGNATQEAVSKEEMEGNRLYYDRVKVITAIQMNGGIRSPSFKGSLPRVFPS